VDPWSAVLVSTFAFVATGFAAARCLMARVFGLGAPASVLGAAFFSANGFYLEHLAAGHLGFQPFPLLPALALALAHPALPGWVAGLLASLIAALLVHSGGFVIAVIFALSLAIVLPLLAVLRPGVLPARRLASALGWGAIASAALCGSKAWAVHSLMRFFPRLASDSYEVGWAQGLLGLLLQLLGAMALAPAHWVCGRDLAQLPAALQRATGARLGLWELDVSVSPALWPLLLGGSLALARAGWRRGGAGGARAPWLALALLAAGVWLAIEFTLARGGLYPRLRGLPVLASLQANVRFAAAFLLPLAVLGAAAFQRWSRDRRSRARVLLAFALLDAATLAALGSYLLLPGALQARTFDVSSGVAAWREIEQRGERYPIEAVARVGDADVFRERASSLLPYDVVFGHWMEEFRPQLRVGSVWEVREGRFNLHDPTGFVFPEENGSAAFSRIPESDREKLDAFVHRRQPDWKLPRSQRIWNALSLSTLALELLALAALLGRAGARRWRACRAGRGARGQGPR
jgi:hypothetical protein